MNCETCGAAVAAGSSYCSRCGSSAAPRAGAGPARPDGHFALVQSLIWAIVALAIAGTGVVIGLMTVMKQVLEFPAEAIAGFSIVAFAVVFGAAALFVWMLLRVWRGAGPAARPASAPPAVAAAVTAPRLQAEPASVTEHTTREFADAARPGGPAE